MTFDKSDPLLDALIDQFNEQTRKGRWDEAYGTCVAIEERYKYLAQDVGYVAQTLARGVITRATEKAKERMK